MIGCSKCGASNGLGMVVCRMCGSALTQTDGTDSRAPGVDSLDSTVVLQTLRPDQGPAALKECFICPECQTIGQTGWLFCPQCGKLVDASFQRTTDRPDQKATIEEIMFPDQGAQNSRVTVAEPMRFSDGWVIAGDRDEGRPIPQQPDQWPVAPDPAIPEGRRQNPSEQKISAADSPNGAPDKERKAPAAAREKDTVACADCGSENDSKYSFCLSCGAALLVTKTVVMASASNTVRPRLRLLVQGEASGPTYEIKNEASIGRTEGTITFPRDNFMSSTHARIVKRGKDFMLIDDASSNGTFIKVKSETKLEPGDVILVGGQLLRYEA